MPAKRKTPAESSSSSVPKRRPQSKLAKENKITAEEEIEIKEAFQLFAVSMKGEKEGVLPIGDVRRAMIALNLPPSPQEIQEYTSILDPEHEGFAIYPSFLAICALKLHSRTRSSSSHAQEVDEAFNLFIKGGGEGKITLATLKRVAQALKEDVDEALLRDMILEANGGGGVGRGVERDEFEGVMRRAGIWR